MATSSKTSDSKSTEITVEDLSAQLDLLKTEIATLTSSMSAFGQSKMGEARDTAQAKATELRDTAQLHAMELSNAGIERARETQRQVDDFIRTQPGTAIGIAAGAGFLFGLLTARR